MATILNLTISPIPTLVIAGSSLLGYIFVWALIAIHKKRADLADIAWGLGFFLVAWISFVLSPFSYPSLFVNLMVTAWSLRLAIHIARRNRNRNEDFRYENLKKNGGTKLQLRIFFQVFLLQGAILYIVAFPILWINTHPQIIGFNSLVFAFPFWLIGFLIETVADIQLARFQKNPSNRGKLLTTGIWGYVRHPNYLGELIQWWVFWALCANFVLLISPLLITFLIIKVSGIAPLEKKMRSHPDFLSYAAKTPSLIPFSWVNGALYTIGWFAIVCFGAKSSFIIPLSISMILYGTQLFLFSKYDRKSLEISPLLSIYALFFGLVQETILINSNLLQYPDQGVLPPLWLLCLYLLFALNLNSSLHLINKNLVFAFFIGGVGALLSYIYAAKFGSVALILPLAYPFIFLFWGLYLVILVLLNRRIHQISEKYRNTLHLDNTLTVFFDQNCPICSLEMEKLQKRKQTGRIVYDCLTSEEEFKKKISRISYDSAMKKIQAIDSKGEIFSGIDALSEIYARTNLLWLAISLQAPGFRQLFILGYAIWAKFRKNL